MKSDLSSICDKAFAASQEYERGGALAVQRDVGRHLACSNNLRDFQRLVDSTAAIIDVNNINRRRIAQKFNKLEGASSRQASRKFDFAA